MAVALPKLNSLEKTIVGAALVIGALLMLLRFGVFATLWYLHHAR